MAQNRLPEIAVALTILAVGCEGSQSPEVMTPMATPKGQVHIERFEDAEAVLDQLGLASWVFKHRGGELTSEFTIYHRPPGKDQTETVIFSANGDTAVLVARNDRDRQNDEDVAETREDGGYLIVTVPEHLEQGRGYVTHSFSLSGARVSHTDSVNNIYAETVYADSFHAEPTPEGRPGVSSISWGGASSKPLELTPRESKVLVNLTKRLSRPGTTELPIDEREMVRYVLTVTALKDGVLPKRDAPADDH